MNQRALRVLEYDKIITLLEKEATSESGKAMCRRLKPMANPDRIARAQRETADALARVTRNGVLPFDGLKNPAFPAKRLEIGAALSAKELLSIRALLSVAKRAKSYSHEIREDIEPDSLDKMFSSLEPLTPLAQEIARCVPAPDEISDDASSGLRDVRRRIRATGEKIRGSVNNLLNDPATRACLQDAVVTMRNDRYCLPVRSEHRAQIPGMIHDQSSSGSTLFVEPVSVVRLNNDLRELFLKERQEIEAILASLSNRAAEHISEITKNFRVLTLLDFIFAKAKLAENQHAMPPLFNTEGRIHIRKGRHPLLDARTVVPIDIRLGEEFRLLVVTGPNTGGKTVSLKTAGLFTLMGQAGLHIPAGDHSELTIFKQVYADIGDEQSIEQSLSTFSSHMTNIVSILKKADRASLVLFDELCAGTDPDEGAALAISILDQLRRRGIPAMATTHYSELKLYALSTDGVENACCEFDVESLNPTYRLLTGIPGKSNAFTISRKLGLPQRLIEEARSHISKENEDFENIIADLEQSRRAIRKEQAQIKEYRRQAEEEKRRVEERQEKLDKNRERLIRDANEQAAAILKEAKDVADETIRNFQKFGRSGADAAKMEREREKVRKKMREAKNKSSAQKQAKRENTNVPKNLRPGDGVKVLSMNLKGTVHTLPDARGNLFVQMGILRYQVNVKDLVLLEEEDPKKIYAPKAGSEGMDLSKSVSISPEIRLIGMTVDEAIPTLDKYLDDACLAQLKSVRIVHGKGTGTLRKAVQNYLKRQPCVAKYHIGEFGEGDAGVTIATLK